MSKRNEPKKDLKKTIEEDEWKKKRRFSDDPIVRKYTQTTYHSFKSGDDEYRKKREEEEFKKKKYELESEKKAAFNYDYGSYKEKGGEGDDFKKHKKDMSNILDEMFKKKDDKSFSSAQYGETTKSTSSGEEGRHRRQSSEFLQDRKKVKEHKIIKQDDDRKRDDESRKNALEEEARRKRKEDEYYGAKIGDGGAHKPGELPGFEKKKKKFDEDELKKTGKDESGVKVSKSAANLSRHDEDVKKKRKTSLQKSQSKSSQVSDKRDEDLEARRRKEAEDELEAKREKAKKEKKQRLAAELAESRKTKSSSAVTSATATFSTSMKGTSEMPDFEKKKKKFDIEYSGSISSGASSRSTGKKMSEEKFEKKKKKSFDYETLFPKEKPITDEKLKQQYAASQPYRSISTSGSRTSLDEEPAAGEVSSSLSIGATSKLGSKSKSGSTIKLATRSKKVSDTKVKKDKSPTRRSKEDIYSQDLFIRLKIRKEDAPIRVQNYLREKNDYPVNFVKRTIKYFILKDGERIENSEYELLGKCMEAELLKGGAITNLDQYFLESMNIAYDEPTVKKRLIRFEIEIRAIYTENASSPEFEKAIRLYFDLRTEKLTPFELNRLHKIMKDELATKKGGDLSSKESRSRVVRGRSGKDMYSNDVFVKMKIKREDAPIRVQEYAEAKGDYPTNYYKRTNRYFNIKDSEKIDNPQYELLGKCMETELLKGGEITNSDKNDFLDSLNVPYDEVSKKKRITRFEIELKSFYSENPSPVEMEKLVRLHFELKTEKLSPFEINRLFKIMKEELLPKKYAFNTDVISKEKRINEHKEIVDKVCQKNKDEDLNEGDVTSYFSIPGNATSSTKNDLDLLIELLTSEVIDGKLPEFQEVFTQNNQIPTDSKSKKERYNRFKTDLLVTYDVDNLKYFIGKYFNKNPEQITDQEMPVLFRIMKIEVEREMANEPKAKQEELQRVVNLMGNEVKIVKDQKDSGDGDMSKAIKSDQQALAERIKRFKDIILPDYKSGAKKLDYKDRIAMYFNINLDNYSPYEIEAFGHLMDAELKDNGVQFVGADDQFLQDKHVDLNESKRVERAKRHSLNGDKEKELLKNLDTKQLVSKYYEIDTSDLNNEDLIQFSSFMVDEILNGDSEKPKLESTIQLFKNKGVDLSPAKRQQRRLRFKNEIEPQLKMSIKNLDYVSTVARYFEMGNIGKLNMLDIARLKRLMDREIRQLVKVELGDRYKISFDENAIKDRLKKFKDTVEPDYKRNLRKLTYQTRIALYFGLDVNQMKKDDLEKLGKLMEDELALNGCNQFPTDDDLYLMQLNLPVRPSDKKRRMLRLRNELERNPVKSNNPFYLLKVYFDIKNMDRLNDENLQRLIRIMEEEQLKLNGDLIANLLKNRTDQEKLLALINLLQLRDFDRMKNSNYTIYMRIEEQSGDGKTTVNEYNFRINKDKNLNEEVLRLERENAMKINELRQAIELKIKDSKAQLKDSAIENLKKELEQEVQNQNELKVDIAKSGIDDREEQQKLLEKLAEQQRHLEEQKNARIREEAERLRRETEEKYKKQLDNLDEEEKQKEMKELEELEKRKAELIQKRRQEHLERKKKLQEEVERANRENETKLKEHAKLFEEDIKQQLEQSRKKLDEDYKKIKLANKELAQKYKKEFDNEKQKIEIHLTIVEKRITELRKADEEERKNRLKAKAKELEELNTKKLKEEAFRLETEARAQVKEITLKLEEEINREDQAGKENVVEEANQKRLQMVSELNEKNRKKLEQMEKALEEEAMAILDRLAKELEIESKKRIDKQIEQDRKETEQQIAKLRETLAKMMKG